MIHEFLTPEFEGWFWQYKFLRRDIDRAAELSPNEWIHSLFSRVAAAFERAYSQVAKVDYDYPLRASQFIREIIAVRDTLLTLAAAAYINLLCTSRDDNAKTQGWILQEMLQSYLICGTLPKTAQDVYGKAAR